MKREALENFKYLHCTQSNNVAECKMNSCQLQLKVNILHVFQTLQWRLQALFSRTVVKVDYTLLQRHQVSKDCRRLARFQEWPLTRLYCFQAIWPNMWGYIYICLKFQIYIYLYLFSLRMSIKKPAIEMRIFQRIFNHR